MSIESTNFGDYQGIAAPAVSPVGEGRIYYDSASNTFKLSMNGGPYNDIVTSGSSGTLTLQKAYDGGATISLSAAKPISITKSVVDATDALDITVTAGTGLAALFSGASISCPDTGSLSERFGSGATAAGVHSTAFGNGATANGSPSTAIGFGANAAANLTVALGAGTTAGFTQSVAIGAGASTTATNQIAFGSDSAPLTSLYFGRGASSTAAPSSVLFSATNSSTPIVPGTAIVIQGGTGGTSASGGSITINGGVAGAATPAGGDIILQTAKALAGTTLVERFRVTTDGALDATGIATAAQPAVSAGSHGRIYYDSTSQVFMASVNGGPYQFIVTSGSGGTISLQNAYNGGASIIEAGAVPVSFSSTTSDNSDVLQLTKNPGTSQSGNALSITKGANSTGLAAKMVGASSLLTITNNANAVPLGICDIVEDGASANIFLTSFGVSGLTNSSTYVGRGARGTLAAPTASQTDDALAVLSGRGYGATGFSSASRGRLGIFAAEAWSDTAQGTYLSLQATPTTTAAPNEVLRLATTTTTATFTAGNGQTAATPVSVVLTGTASTTAGTTGSAITIQPGTAGSTAAGATLTLRGGTGGTSGGAVAITGGTPTLGAGGNINITATNGAGGGNAGGVVSIIAGNGQGGGASGSISLTGGGQSGNGIGGGITLTGGAGGNGSGDGGPVTVIGGTPQAGSFNGGVVTVQGGTAGNSGTGGNVFVNGGLAAAAPRSGGDVVIQTAVAGTGTTLTERFRVASDGALDATGIPTVSAPAVSAANHGRIYYDSTTQTFRASTNTGAYSNLITASIFNLQNAYAGGATISVTGAVPVSFSDTASDASNVLNITKNPGTSQAGVGISVTMGANSTGNGITITSTGSGLVLLSTGASISVPDGTNAERHGAGATAAGASSISFGNGATASGLNSTALGASTSTAGFAGAIALGIGATNTAANQMVVGSATQSITTIYFGNGVTSTAPADYTFNATSSATNGVAGGAINLLAGTGQTTGQGGGISVTAGSGGGTGVGGTLNLNGGAGGNSGGGAAGGAIAITGGAAGGSGGGNPGGAITISGGQASRNNTGGAVTIAGGTAALAAGIGGDIILQTAPSGAATVLVERFRIVQDGAFRATGIATASAPAVSGASNGRFYFDSTAQTFMVSENTSAYRRGFVTASSTAGPGAAFSTTSAADVAVTGMSLALTPGTWIVVFAGSMSSSAIAQVRASIFSGGVLTTDSKRFATLTAANQLFPFCCTTIVTLAANTTIDGRFSTSAGTGTVTAERDIYAIRVG